MAALLFYSVVIGYGDIMRILKAKAVAALQTQFPSLTLSTENISVLHKGRFANAIVFRYRDENLDVVIKDYSHCPAVIRQTIGRRSEEHTSELQSRENIVCRLLLARTQML